MKQLFFLLSVLISFNAIAQNNFQQFLKPTYKTLKHKRSADERLKYMYNFNTNSGTMSLYTTDTFSYSGYRNISQYFDYSFAYNIDFEGCDLHYNKIAITSSSNIIRKTLSEYNLKDQIISSLDLTYNSISGNYDSAFKQIYVYDANNQVDSVYGYYYSTSSWNLYTLTTYDHVGFQLTDVQNYDYVSGSWNKINRQSYTYSNNNLIKAEGFNGNNNIWNNNLYADYIYNSNNKLDSIMVYVYDTSSASWKNSQYIDYGYVTDTNIFILIHNWDSTFFNPVGYQKVKLNSNYLPDTVETGNYSSSTLPTERTIYNYTLLNNVARKTLQSYTTAWQSNYDSTRYEYETFNNNLSTKGLIGLNYLKAYPNPVANNFFLEYDIKTTNTIRIEIMDVLGKIIFSKTRKGFNGNDLINIDTKNWDKGVYIVSIYDGNTRVGASKIVK